MGYTASFSPKPLSNINENGMYINLSISKEGKNLFYSQKDLSTSAFAKELAIKILFHAKELCLIFNLSANSYRRLDPKFEVPNEIKMSALDRSAIIRATFEHT